MHTWDESRGGKVLTGTIAGFISGSSCPMYARKEMCCILPRNGAPTYVPAYFVDLGGFQPTAAAFLSTFDRGGRVSSSSFDVKIEMSVKRTFEEEDRLLDMSSSSSSLHFYASFLPSFLRVPVCLSVC